MGFRPTETGTEEKVGHVFSARIRVLTWILKKRNKAVDMELMHKPMALKEKSQATQGQ